MKALDFLREVLIWLGTIICTITIYRFAYMHARRFFFSKKLKRILQKEHTVEFNELIKNVTIEDLVSNFYLDRNIVELIIKYKKENFFNDKDIDYAKKA